ncbi:aminopeptidase N [Nisaea acidiphila]|uniref:Aminopeptidase N n=1 Tax=Nisaea acidiphila TaxID=1862145 RepID=A0A9J7AXX7_9PROT|nr:aminopeptidase N [Nisaea acidiphila]UUX50277.1 aminopeptidase N [Nisaea acidiphila]
MTRVENAAGPQVKRLSDYTPPAFMIDTVALDFDLRDGETKVASTLQGRRNPQTTDITDVLELDGQGLRLLSISLNGAAVPEGGYRIEGDKLFLSAVPENFTLEIVTTIEPEKNTALEGLYMSDGMYCTQCEAEGFRRITYFPDRPDVMAVYTTRLEADADRFPVLLSNGNLMQSGMLDEGRHFAVWHDPFPKPSYLFAAVAGDLACVRDSFRTMSGREVELRVYVEHGNEHLTGHTMDSLKRSMKWDEERFGLEYDLDLFMIVAVSHFNMGAMENKGLNIFNSKFVLADPQTATDADYERLEGIVAHEYFHNWTGNRVTCRDWFQLSLKEGLTVFRDQEFTSDTHSRGVKRVADARLLRAVQFPEDAGPTAHPVRPESYLEINNFYTVTIYEKGAEVIRMIHELLGADAFRRGMDLYFERHDGQAVRCEDFVAAMEDASGIDLGQFRLWYSQSGTPELEVDLAHDPDAKTATLKVRQILPPTPGQPAKEPMLIPLSMALLDGEGQALPLQLLGENAEDIPKARVLPVSQSEQVFVFENVDDRPVPSLLRGFSAPVRLRTNRTAEQECFLYRHDDDPFARWDAGQAYLTGALTAAARKGRYDAVLDDDFLQAVGEILSGPDIEPAFAAELLTLPGESVLADAMTPADPEAIHAARNAARREIGLRHAGLFQESYDRLSIAHDPEDMSTAAMGSRALKAVALGYLVAGGDTGAVALAALQAAAATTMTESMSALQALNNVDCPERRDAMKAFHDRWQDTPLVLDKWFTLSATSSLPDTLETVKRLLEHPKFDLATPNRVRAVIGAFSSGNPVRFHAPDGAGYNFLADQVVRLDEMNPQVAARLVAPLTRWKRYDEARQRMMRQCLERIRRYAGLSPDVTELVAKGLGEES